MICLSSDVLIRTDLGASEKSIRVFAHMQNTAVFEFTIVFSQLDRNST